MRGKVSEQEKHMKRLKSQPAMDLRRAEARALRVIEKLKVKSEYDVEVAKQAGEAEANYWISVHFLRRSEPIAPMRT